MQWLAKGGGVRGDRTEVCVTSARSSEKFKETVPDCVGSYVARESTLLLRQKNGGVGVCGEGLWSFGRLDKSKCLF